MFLRMVGNRGTELNHDTDIRQVKNNRLNPFPHETKVGADQIETICRLQIKCKKKNDNFCI